MKPGKVLKTLDCLRSGRCEAYLESELLVEGGVEGLPVDLGLKLLLLVRQQVDLHVWVRGAAHVHGRQLCSLDDPHYELKEEGQGLESEKKHLNGVFTLEEHTNDTEGFSRWTGAPRLVVTNPIGPLDRDGQIVRPNTFQVLHPLYKRSTGSLPDTVRSNKRVY